MGPGGIRIASPLKRVRGPCGRGPWSTPPGAVGGGDSDPGTARRGRIVLRVLEPIPPGLSRAAFMALLEERIETASAELAGD